MALSAYIHIPFCSQKCDFCDFVVVVGQERRIEDYCAAVAQEIKARIADMPNQNPLSTIFYGGGTPGYIDVDNLRLIHQTLSQEIGIAPQAEVTLETTAQAISRQKLEEWLSLGINRLSIGVESLNDHELKAVGRPGTRAGALSALDMAFSSQFNNIAVDLMYGLPKQTLESWTSTLKEILSYPVKHLSAYALTLSHNSPLQLRYPPDSAEYLDESMQVKLYERLIDLALSFGLVHYEISNFSASGFECQHNLQYWQNQEYLGFGVGAHRYINRVRSANVRSFKKYIDDPLGTEFAETIDDQTRIKEGIFLGLRMCAGIQLSDFKKSYGLNLEERHFKEISHFVEGGFLQLSRDTLKLSDKGRLVSNLILSEFM